MTLPIRRLSRALAIPALAYVPVLVLFVLQVQNAVETASRQVGMTIRVVPEALWVDVVEEGGAAESLGLSAGDVLTAVDDRPIVELAIPEIGEALTRSGPSRVWTVTRAGEPTALELVGAGQGSDSGPGWAVRWAEAGLLVTRVADDGKAEEAGLAKNDLILEVGGQRVDSLGSYSVVAHDFERGEEVAFRVRRGEELVDLEISPGGRILVGVLAFNALIILLYVWMGLVSLAKRPASLPASLLWQLSVLLSMEVALPLDLIGAPRLDFLTPIAYFLLSGIQLGTDFHLVSVIPERRSWLKRRPWIVPAYYTTGAVFGLNAAVTYLLASVDMDGAVLPWTAAEAQTLLSETILPIWALGLMIILAGPAFTHPRRRGRKQAGLVLLGLAPWSTYILVLEVLGWMNVQLPGWVDNFWALILLPFPISIYFVLAEAARVRQRILVDLIERVQDAGTLEAIEALVRRDLDLAFHVKHSFVFLRDKRSSQLTTTHIGPEGRTEIERIPDGYEVLKTLERAGRALAYPEDFRDDLPVEERRWLDRLQASLVVPLVGAHHRLTGLLVLADKTSEEPFTPDDLQLLRALSGQIALACENLGLQAEVEEKEREQQEMLERLQGEDLRLVKVCPRCRSCFGSDQSVCPLDGVKLVIPHPVERVVRDRYRLDGEIGKGGLATVFEAWDLHLERPVAVKVLTRSLVESPASLHRFQREARLAARLVHPAIVTVHDFGKTETGSPFLVMERVRGATLGEILEREGRLSAPKVADWFDQMLGGLAAAHRAGVVHRDLKPDNVMVSTQGDRAIVKIVDFGLAKIRESGGMSATAPGVVLGTLSYMSPEQLKGTEIDVRADIFAVGVMTVECLTGSRPFSGKDPAQVLTSILNDPFELEGEDAATRRLSGVLARCLHKEREMRWESADELRRRLVPALRDLPGPRHVSDPEKVSTEARPVTEIMEPRDNVR